MCINEGRRTNLKVKISKYKYTQSKSIKAPKYNNIKMQRHRDIEKKKCKTARTMNRKDVET